MPVLHGYCVLGLSKHTYVIGMVQAFQNCAQIRIWIRNRSFGYAQRKTVNLTEMRVKFEFFHLNLFVSGPVFDYLSNERGLVRVCGYLGAVLCAAFEVRRFSSVSKFEFLTIFAN
mgnify:CR=1 FL=1